MAEPRPSPSWYQSIGASFADRLVLEKKLKTPTNGLDEATEGIPPPPPKKKPKTSANGTDEDAEQDGTQGADKNLNKKQKDLVKSITSFRIIFEGTPQARTTSVSSDELKAAQRVDKSQEKLMGLITLHTVRKRGKLSRAYLFCINDTNTVPDTTLLGDYILMVKDNIISLQDEEPIFTVRYVSRFHRSGISRYRRPHKISPPPILPSAGEDDSKNAEVENTEDVNTDTEAEAGYIVSTHPAELTEQQWNYVMVTNSLLHGMFFDKTSFSLQKAREPAFKLKASFRDRFYGTGSAKGDGSIGSDTANEEAEHFRIPAFEVNDESFVKITEVKTKLQLSMVQQGFSSWNAGLSASGGITGIYSGSVSASADSLSSSSSNLNQGEVINCLHASYNFPRVKVFLDADDLEISHDCQKLLEKIETHKRPDDVTKFYRKYGHIFATSVQLGGRLHTTKDSSATTTAEAKVEKIEFKAAVGANFSASFASGSGSISAAYAKNNDSQMDKLNEKSFEGLCWEAQGGETLLGSNPAAWITTVGSFYNWRVIQRSNTNSVLTLLKDISNKDWPSIFCNIENVLVRIAPPPQSDVIQIKNDGNSWVRVAVSNATSPVESSKFFAIPPGKSNIWKRTGKESAFINGGGFGRVAIAIAEPGSYKIQELDYVDPNIEYVHNPDLAEQISVTNNLATTIQIRVTTNSGTGEQKFTDVDPGKTEKWTRSDLETIFVKHPASFGLFTYLGISGQDLQINGASYSPAPKFEYVHELNEDQISVFNWLDNKINVKISSVTYPNGPGSERFYPVEVHRKLDPWTRTEPEVIFVNANGTTVWAYYGHPSFTLVTSV